jgi:hypothetical protein
MFLPVESLINCVNTSADDINAGNEKGPAYMKDKICVPSLGENVN